MRRGLKGFRNLKDIRLGLSNVIQNNKDHETVTLALVYKQNATIWKEKRMNCLTQYESYFIGCLKLNN